MHHAEKYGWLAHTTRMMRLAKSICQSINKYSHVINEDMVVAGCMLHDLGKLYELKPNELGSGDYTKNSLLGHIYISASIVRDMEKVGLNNLSWLRSLSFIFCKAATDISVLCI